MARFATSLESLDELKLSKGTRNFFARNEFAMEELVQAGRKADIEFEKDPESIFDAPKWQQELVSAIIEAGFTRKDLYPLTYQVWQFYKELFTDEIYDFFADFVYENHPAISEMMLHEIMRPIKTLPDREAEVITERFGLTGEKPKSLDELGEKYGCRRENVRKSEARAIRKLRSPYRMAMLPELFGFKHPDGNLDDLNLSDRLYNTLKYAGINTITEILDYPKADWKEVRNFGHHDAKELEEKMHSYGKRCLSFRTNLY